MIDDVDAINEVLGGFTPLGEEHPAAQQTVQSVLDEWAAAPAPAMHVEVRVLPGVLVRPGDVLILEGAGLRSEQAMMIKQAVKNMMPDLADVLVLGVHIGGVYRKEDEPCDPT